MLFKACPCCFCCSFVACRAISNGSILPHSSFALSLDRAIMSSKVTTKSSVAAAPAAGSDGSAVSQIAFMAQHKGQSSHKRRASKSQHAITTVHHAANTHSREQQHAVNECTQPAERRAEGTEG